MQALFSWLAHYGYAALFLLLMFGIIGLPIPDETLLFFCGYLIWKGRLHFDLTLLTAFSGSAFGITVSYLIGRKYGRRVLHRYGPRIYLTHALVRRSCNWFHRIGGWALTVGYFIPGVRHFTALIAGISHFRFRNFALFAYLGAAIWVSTFVCLGYIVGEQWEQTSELVHRYLLMATGILAIAALIWWRIRRPNPNSTR